MTANDRIPHRAFAVLLPAMVIEAGVLQLPQLIIGTSGTWAWLAACIASFVLVANVILIVQVVRRLGFIEYRRLLASLFGSGLGRVILVLHGIVFLLRAARIGRTTAELITQELLFRTPLWVLIVVGFLMVGMLARHGAEPVARFTAIAFPLYYGAMMLAFALAMFRGRPSALLDLSDLSASRILSGVTALAPEMQGYTLLLVFLPWAWRRQRVLGPVLAGAGLIALLAVAIMVSAIMVLGRPAALLTWPTLELIEVISVPGLLVERLEAVFFSFWLFAVVTVVLLTLFGAAYMLTAGLWPSLPMSMAAPVTAALMTILAILPPNVALANELQRTVLHNIGWAEILFPAVLWVLARRRPRVRSA